MPQRHDGMLHWLHDGGVNGNDRIDFQKIPHSLANRFAFSLMILCPFVHLHHPPLSLHLVVHRLQLGNANVSSLQAPR